MALPRNLVRLIESLRRAFPAGRTVEALAGELNIQNWRVSELIGRLEGMNLPLEHSGQSLRLDPADTPLLAELIELELGTRRVGQSILVFGQAASTNDVAWQAARRRESDGLVVLAETQTAGRGRLGRSWLDRPGASLLFSLLLLDLPRAEELTNQLVMSASVALAEAIDEATGLAAAIRWPNDLYLHGRKAGGILAESREGGRGRSALSPTAADKGTAPVVDVVVGIGLNCNQSAEDFPPDLTGKAVSLALELGRRVDRTALCRAILRRLDHWLGGAAPDSAVVGKAGAKTASDPSLLHGQYLRWMDHQARRVRIHHGAEVIEATVRDVDPLTGLIVELPAGGVAHFAPAAVSVEWLGG